MKCKASYALKTLENEIQNKLCVKVNLRIWKAR